jgi:hypothetical protein
MQGGLAGAMKPLVRALHCPSSTAANSLAATANEHVRAGVLCFRSQACAVALSLCSSNEHVSSGVLSCCPSVVQ